MITRCNTLQHTATHYNAIPYIAKHCNTLHYTATHEGCWIYCRTTSKPLPPPLPLCPHLFLSAPTPCPSLIYPVFFSNISVLFRQYIQMFFSLLSSRSSQLYAVVFRQCIQLFSFNVSSCSFPMCPEAFLQSIQRFFLLCIQLFVSIYPPVLFQ